MWSGWFGYGMMENVMVCRDEMKAFMLEPGGKEFGVI